MQFFQKIVSSFRSLFRSPSGGGGIEKIFAAAGLFRRGSVQQDPYGNIAGFVYRAIMLRSNAVGCMNTRVFELKGKDVEEVEESPLSVLLDRANPQQTRFDFFKLLEIYLCVWGAAPVFLDRGSGRVIQNLWPIRPDLLERRTNRAGETIGYRYRLGSWTEDFLPEEIIYIRDQDPRNPLNGLSPLFAASLEIDSDVTAAVWNRFVLDNMAEPGFVLSTDQALSEQAFKRLQKQWEARYGGPKNARKTAILEMGLKPQLISHSPKEMDWIKSREFNRDAILQIMGVPKAIVETDGQPRANMESAEYIFAKYTIDPQMRLVTEQLSEFLAPLFSENQWITYDSPVRGDREQRRAYLASAVDSWITVNEAREMEGMPPLEGGDMIQKPISLFPSVGPEKRAEAVETIILRGGQTKNRHPHADYCRRKILARTYWKRKRAELAGRVAERVYEAISRKIAEGKKIRKVNGARFKKNDKSESPADHPVLVEDRKNYLERRLPIRVKQARELLRRYFTEQEKIVRDNLKQVGLPDKITANQEQRSAQNWIKRIVFDKAAQAEVLTKLARGMLEENVQEGAEDVAKILGVAVEDVARRASTVEYLLARSEFIGWETNETTMKRLAASLAEGIDAGDDLGRIGDRIAQVYDEARGFRTETIARTEVGGAQNFGRNEEMIAQGVERKVWIASFQNTRKDHDDAHDQVVGTDENFFVGGEELEYPGDPQGSPENIINCQCNESPTLKPLT